MAEYIEREEALKAIESASAWGSNTAYEAVQEVPAADVAPVVRCKDCKHLMFSDIYGECRKGYMGIVHPDDFCSRGVPKED